MSTYLKKSDPLVMCPYDPVHKVKQSRLQLHIAKCQANCPEKKICPFNAQHRIDEGDFQYHVLNCPDRGTVDKMVTRRNENNTFKGYTEVPPYHQNPVPVSESWEREMSAHAAPGYKPRSAPPKDGLICDLGMTKPAERRKIYRQLHTNDDDIDSVLESSKTETSPDNLRQPKQRFEEILSKPGNLTNLGLGRGQPPSSNRIAANIFGTQEPEINMRQPRYLADAVTGIKNLNLGMGRGRGIRGAAAQQYNADFPPLGLPVPGNVTNGASQNS